MVRAGYNPQGAVSFWNKVVAQEKQGTKIDFLSTHPTSEKEL
jgi:predicted Zn-dependent protease